MASVSHVGLINLQGVGYVNAVLQGLLAVPDIIKFLEEDILHRKRCKTILKCTMCALYKLWEKMNARSIQNPAFFVHKWQAISSAMAHDKRHDPFEVLMFLIHRLRLEYVQRNEDFSYEDLHSTPLGKIFQGQHTCIVSCPSCSSIPRTDPFIHVDITLDEDGLVSAPVTSHFQREMTMLCDMCGEFEGFSETLFVKYPKSLIVNIKVCCSNLNFEHKIDLNGNDFTILCCVLKVESREKSTYLCCSFGSDNLCRLYEDTKVTSISLAQLMNSQFWSHSKITLIYKETSTARTGALASDTKTEKISKCFHACTKTPKNLRIVQVSKGDQTDSLYTRISYESCKTHEKFKFFTGLSIEDFEDLYELLGGDDVVRRLKLQYQDTTPQKLRKTKLTGKDRLFMFLIRLRRGLPLEELAFVFDVHMATVSKICYAMTRHIYDTFKTMEKDMFASAKHQSKKKPAVMRPFKNLRVIIDGASFYIEAPKNFEMQENTFSRYKSHNVLIFVIGVSCSIATVFCSPDFEGSMSDKECFLNSGLLDLLETGDGVMADRGFEITAELQERGCHFYNPPSLGDRNNLTAEEDIFTKAIAAARIYSEHAIADIKDNRLLQGVIPIVMLPVIGQLVYIAAYLSNFNPTRINDEKVIVTETK